MDFGDFKGIWMLVGLLVLIAARRRKKQAEAREQDVREYEPIEPEAVGPGMNISKIFSTASRAYSIIIQVAFVAALFYTALFKQDNNWIVLGLVAVIVIIFMVKKARQSDVTPEFNPEDPWEE